MIDEETLAAVLKLWEIQLKSARPDLVISGSPDRCLSRTVVEDRSGSLLVMEKLPAASHKRKTEISDSLAFLGQKRMPAVFPYLPLESEMRMVQKHGYWWQILPFIPGSPLKRPDYVDQDWRGKEAAEFLANLKNYSTGIPRGDKSSSFSIAAFITDLVDTLKKDRPILLGKIKSAVEYLQAGIMSAHDRLPVSFCHGDFHPLNIIWSGTGIQAVIDWEFCGFKPEIYDAANMVGCLGMEIPKALQGGFTYAFVDRLNELALFQPQSRRLFFDFVLALRFAWLSEWLHVKDEEMVDLEAVYINLLLDNRGVLSRSWGFPVET